VAKLESLPAVARHRDENKLAETLADEIEQEIAKLNWPIGQLLGTEPELLERHKVSRSVLREAIRIIEHHGAARMRRGYRGGLIVTEPDSRATAKAFSLCLDFMNVSPTQLFEVRRDLELTCVEKTCDLMDDGRAEVLLSALEAERNPNEELDYHRIHIVIAHLTGNPAMALFVEVLAEVTKDQSLLGSRDLAHNPQIESNVNTAHRKIVESLIARDMVHARSRMLQHLESVRDWICC
jgi:DNA-binding FadR family transcriptional regulator